MHFTVHQSNVDVLSTNGIVRIAQPRKCFIFEAALNKYEHFYGGIGLRKRNVLIYLVVAINCIFFGYVGSSLLVNILSHVNLSTVGEGILFDSGLMADPDMQKFLLYGKYVVLASIVLCLLDAVIVFVKEEHNVLLFVFALLFYPVYLLLRNRITDDTSWPFKILLIGLLLLVAAGGYDTYQLSKKDPAPYLDENAVPYIAELKNHYFEFDTEHSIYKLMKLIMDDPTFTVYDASIRDDYIECTGMVPTEDNALFCMRFSIKDCSLIYMSKNNVKLGESERDVILKDLASQVR